jgi:hypothetical protein
MSKEVIDMSKKKSKQKKASNITKELQGFIEKKEKQKNEPTKVNVQNLLELIPDAKINKRKDNYIKFYEANCYVKDMSYGIQFRESISGAPTGKLTRIETPEQLQDIVKTIKHRIENYVPLSKPVSKLDENAEVGIIIKVATRNRIKEQKKPGESYNRFLNRILDGIKQ